MLDTKRHDRLFDKHAFAEPVHIIGVGSVGSNLARLLAKLGVGVASPVTVYDGDRVEPHNPPNQTYNNDQIGGYKAEALKAQYLKWSGGVEIRAHAAFFSASLPLSGVVFLCLDTMEERRRIARGSIWANPEVKLLIETRTSDSHAMVFALDPNRERHVRRWEQLWYPTPSEPEVDGYGGPQSIIISADATAVFAAQRLVEFSRRRDPEDLLNRFWVDITTGETFSEKW